MSEIAALYVCKAFHIYDSASKLTKGKADSFGTFSNFCELVTNFTKTRMIKDFKNISKDICKFIDSGNFDIKKTTSIFDQIVKVDKLAGQLKNKINKPRRFIRKVEEFEKIEKLIEDCYNNMSFSTIDNYKAAFKDADIRWQEYLRRGEEEIQRRKEEGQRRMEEEKRREAERRKEVWQQAKNWQAQGLCRYCGGKFSGLFSKKCTVCGKEKNY